MKENYINKMLTFVNNLYYQTVDKPISPCTYIISWNFHYSSSLARLLTTPSTVNLTKLQYSTLISELHHPDGLTISFIIAFLD